MPQLSPTEVVERQLDSLKAGDLETCFRFASPSNKRATGPWHRFEVMVRQTPAYAPLVGCARFSIVGAIAVGNDRYRCRVRVWPARGVSVPFGVKMPDMGVKFEAPVLDYDWMLSRQSDSAMDYNVAGCWMVDGVLPDASPREVWDEANAQERGDADEGQ